MTAECHLTNDGDYPISWSRHGENLVDTIGDEESQERDVKHRQVSDHLDSHRFRAISSQGSGSIGLNLHHDSFPLVLLRSGLGERLIAIAARYPTRSDDGLLSSSQQACRCPRRPTISASPPPASAAGSARAGSTMESSPGRELSMA